ncbi:protein FAM166B-like [Phymastichus coffea]|uniref:protein FAM166B-like n=1 Tax=Phymastichus coffea TaxID=108790 RepID=UPI00273BC758|nr:protein FAM166B-like [Phymastichus coffea]
MTFDPVTDQQQQEFFQQGCIAHLPGYTGHCPTLKFRVGKRYGACTQEIMKELMEKKILKTGPYRPNSGKENLVPIKREKNIRRDWKKDAYVYKTPYILGYTGYIPGFNSRYGLTFMKAVEEGAVEWREAQNKLKARRDAMRAHAERTDPRNLLSRVRSDNVDIEIDHGHSRKRQYFDNQVTAESPPIVGYTGHIPGAKGEVALSKRYAQAAKKGLELLQKDRESRLGTAKTADAIQRILDDACLDETGHIKA